jgi:hypothetical protein
MTATRRFLRTSWAAKALLFFGLLGFVVSWANACLLHEPMHAGSYQQAAELHDCDPALQDCESSCDPQQGLAATSEPARWLDGVAWPPALPAFAAAWAIERVSPAWRPQTTIGPPGIPVVLRFLRLTL